MPNRSTERSTLRSRELSTVSRMLSSVAAAWLLSLGIDFLLHAGLLARQYLKPSPFLLEPRDAFLRIPLGYLAFLILTFGLYWLFRQLNVRGIIAGFRLGAIAGLVVWGAFVLGLFSISTVGLALSVGWWLGQSLELGAAGAVFGAAAGGTSLRRIWVVVIAIVVACIIVTVFLQATGWSPPMKVE